MSNHNDDHNTNISSLRVGCVLLETSLGDIIIDLPISSIEEERMVYNFIQLCHVRYYTNTLIHTIIPNRFIQLGCPIGNGTGGTCIYGLLDNNNNDDTINDNQQHDYMKSSKRFLKSTSVGRTMTSNEKQEKGHVIATCINGIPDTIGSQFIITTSSGINHSLDGYINKSSTSLHDHNNNDVAVIDHDILFRKFGIVVEDNNNILEQMNSSIFLDDTNRPYTDIRLKRALVIYDPFHKNTSSNNCPTTTSNILIDHKLIRDYMIRHMGIQFDTNHDQDNDSNIIYSPSPERPIEEIVSKRISIEEIKKHQQKIQNENDEDETNNNNEQQLEYIEQKIIQENNTKSSAMILEMLGDIPDATIIAPKNVLFICQLNSITNENDIQLILSRFDNDVQVDLIRDYATGSSLQYAFATFTNNASAEEAYLKMNHVLIDDRRIRIDFSQSVATLWDKYHQKMKNNSTKNINNNSRQPLINMPRLSSSLFNDKKGNNNRNNKNNDNTYHYNSNNRQQQNQSTTTTTKSQYNNNNNKNNPSRQHQQGDLVSNNDRHRRVVDNKDKDETSRREYNKDHNHGRHHDKDYNNDDRRHFNDQHHYRQDVNRRLQHDSSSSKQYHDRNYNNMEDNQRRQHPQQHNQQRSQHKGMHTNDYDDYDDYGRIRHQQHQNSSSKKRSITDDNEPKKWHQQQQKQPHQYDNDDRNQQSHKRRKERNYKEFNDNNESSGEDSYVYNKERYTNNKRRKIDSNSSRNNNDPDDDDNHHMSDQNNADDDDSSRDRRRRHRKSSSSKYHRKKRYDDDSDSDDLKKKKKKSDKKKKKEKKTKKEVKKKHRRHDDDNDDRRKSSSSRKSTIHKKKYRDDDNNSSYSSNSASTSSRDDDSSYSR